MTLKIHSDAIEVATVTACILYNDFTVISLLLCALKCKCNVAQIHCMAVHAFEVLSNSRRYNVNIANIYFCFVMQIMIHISKCIKGFISQRKEMMARN